MKKVAKKRKPLSQLEKSLRTLLHEWTKELKDSRTSAKMDNTLSLNALKRGHDNEAFMYWSSRQFGEGAADAQMRCIADLRQAIQRALEKEGERS